jgi:hypothetical protein
MFSVNVSALTRITSPVLALTTAEEIARYAVSQLCPSEPSPAFATYKVFAAADETDRTNRRDAARARGGNLGRMMGKVYNHSNRESL